MSYMNFFILKTEGELRERHSRGHKSVLWLKMYFLIRKAMCSKTLREAHKQTQECLVVENVAIARTQRPARGKAANLGSFSCRLCA